MRCGMSYLYFSAFWRIDHFFVLRYDDPSKTKNCLLLGIILFVNYVGYYVMFSVMIEMFEFS